MLDRPAEACAAFRNCDVYLVVDGDRWEQFWTLGFVTMMSQF